jgi:bidirectional [NiFe] hydrogenase diaphorase subunit
MGIKTFTLDGEHFSAQEDESILDVARQHKIHIPTLCTLEGLSTTGACRLCLVEIEGQKKLYPACSTKVEEGMVVRTNTERLQKYRRMIVEFLASEGNHSCSVCVSNNHCELQNLAYEVGLIYVHYPYLFPAKRLDATHKDFILDRNRCVLCLRCVRVCDEVEGAHVLDIANRGVNCEIVAEMNMPWGDSESCTKCGKCVTVCPVGSLIEKGINVSEMVKNPNYLKFIVTARTKRQWEFVGNEGD